MHQVIAAYHLDRRAEDCSRQKRRKNKKKKGLMVEVPHFHMKIDPRRATIKNQIICKQYSTASLGSKRGIPENPDMYLTSYPFGLRSFDFADVRTNSPPRLSLAVHPPFPT